MQPTNKIFSASLINQSSFNSESSYQNFCKALDLCKKFYVAKELKLLPEEYRLSELYVLYNSYGNLIYHLPDGTGRGYDVIINVENEFPIDVPDQELEWFDFLKDIEIP